MLRKLLFILVFVCSGAALIVLSSPVSAQVNPGTSLNVANQLTAAAGPGGANINVYEDPRLYVVGLVLTVLKLIGTIFFALTAYAGYLWFSAGGNEEQVDKAKKLLRDGVIGLVIIISSYTITIVATDLALGRSIGYGTAGFTNLNSLLGNGIANGNWW